MQNSRVAGRSAIRFRFRGREVELAAFAPRTTLLDWLRIDQGATGTKEGCAEGDCGACTIVLVRRRGGEVSFAPVNACILLLGQVDGAEIVTVEDLAEGTILHPVQEAMVEAHASQCGFCTPGIVMSLFALHESASVPPARDTIRDQLAGNLCRCTGYRPIVEAAERAGTRAGASPRWWGCDDAGGDLFVGRDEQFFAAPDSIETLAALLVKHPDATLVSGATDVGLWITKGLQDIRKIVWLGRVAGLDAVSDEDGSLKLGAGVTLADALPLLREIHPDLGEVMRRFGSVQVRASGTVGGNLANGSPIGDLAPCLIALGATLELRHGGVTRTLPLEDFFVAYRKQDRRAGEFVTSVTIPKLAASDQFRAYKVTKRLDEDISAVLAAFRFEVVDGRIGRARIAYGGMAGIPARARSAEGFILGARLEDEKSWRGGLTALALDFTPLDDQRASAAYRSLVARNLLKKALMEMRGAPALDLRIAAPRPLSQAASPS
ncbi:MAG: xdhA [Hyphomicrobiales bacterium]|nr:xdhA [Hyphomicrobiales bacterium]